VWLVLLVILALAVSTHAIERHGTEAITAHQAIVQSGHCRDCTDGRTRCVAIKGIRWAVEIRDGDTCITSFWTVSQSYVKELAEQCGNGQFWDHP